MFKKITKFICENRFKFIFLLAVLGQAFLVKNFYSPVWPEQIQWNFIIFVFLFVLSYWIETKVSVKSLNIAAMLIGLFVVFYLLYLVSCFDPEILRRFYDYNVHFINALIAREHDGGWGYNPLYGAGSLSQVFIGFDGHIPAMALRFLSDFSSEKVFFFTTIIMFMVIVIQYAIAIYSLEIDSKNKPLLFAFIASLCVASCGSTSGQTNIEMGLPIYIPISTLNYSEYINLIFYGLTAYSICIGTAFLCRVFFISYINKKKNAYVNILMCYFLASFGTFVHPLFWFVFGLLTLPEIFEQMRLKQIIIRSLFVLSCIGYSFYFNWPWLKALFNFRYMLDYKFPSLLMQTEPIVFFKTVLASPITPFLLITYFISVCWRLKNQAKAKIIVESIIVLFLCAVVCCGSQIGLSKIEPDRFSSLLVILIVFYSVVNIPKAENKTNRKLRFLLICMTMFLLVNTQKTSNLHLVHEEEQINQMAQIINENVTEKQRVLIQETDIWQLKLTSTFTAYALIDKTKAMYLNSLYPLPHTSEVTCSFWKEKFLGRNLRDLSVEEASDLLDLYNVSLVVVATSRAKEFFFNADEYFIKIAEVGKYVFFKKVLVPEELTYVGHAKIKSLAIDEIVLEDVATDKIVLKMHYLEGLSTKDDRVELYPFYIEGRPLPFLGIRNPGYKKDIRIYFDTKLIN